MSTVALMFFAPCVSRCEEFVELNAALSSGEIAVTVLFAAEYCGFAATLNASFTVASLDLQMKANMTREELVVDEASVMSLLRVGDIRINLGDANINGITVGTGSAIHELFDEFYSSHTEVLATPATLFGNQEKMKARR